MPSPEQRRIRAQFSPGADTPEVPLEQARREWEEAAARAPLPPGVAAEALEIAGVPAEWIGTAGQTGGPVLLYLHGGGFTSGSCVTHRPLAAHLSQAAMRVLLLDYRLAPEHPLPAGLEDAVAAYRWLLAGGVAPKRIALGGDSAGAALALGALLRLRDAGLPVPGAAVLLSPWLDLTLSGESIHTRAALDPLTTRAGLARAAELYLGGADPADPLASPLFGDLRGLPPLLIQSADHEVLLSDGVRLAERARRAGVDATLEVWDELWHVWHAWADELPEAREAIARAGAFLRARLATD
ncbi:MAG TPA: alpha/beta hydrolase [Roseiflexaceae bacterium]|nr:alpha/beta hydrolase [Roseiflexaceae bacterium]